MKVQYLAMILSLPSASRALLPLPETTPLSREFFGFLQCDRCVQTTVVRPYCIDYFVARARPKSMQNSNKYSEDLIESHGPTGAVCTLLSSDFLIIRNR